ncbi:MAG: peptidyl-prolyl cis-trans isomerase [Adhaeribacter sp.]|nr:peptidyl-prolyl cis-trans isomerase [Adhaeribacter sp.]
MVRNSPFFISVIFLYLLFSAAGCSGKKKATDTKRLTNENVRKELLKYGQENPETVVLLSTSMGKIKLKLSTETPLHRANFIRLAKMGYYNGTVFHRVIKGHMVQGGDSREPKRDIGKYGVPSEVKPSLVHVRGALAMARYDDEFNPTKASSPDNFYMVQGSPVSEAELQQISQRYGRKYTPAQTKAYLTKGGVPSLDTKYTVFGEVLEGMDVVDKIARVPVDTHDWPSQEIYITMEVLE